MRLTDEQLAQIRALSDMMGRVSVCWNAVGDLLDEVDRLRAELEIVVSVELNPEAGSDQAISEEMSRMGVNER